MSRRLRTSVKASIASLALVAAVFPWTGASAGEAGLCNDRISVRAGQGGYTIGAFPDPSSCGSAGESSSFTLTSGWPSAPDVGAASTVVTVNINGSAFYLEEGSVVSGPTLSGGQITTVRAIAGVSIEETLQLGDNPITGAPDIVNVAYTLEDSAPETREVGLRVLMDPQIGGDDGPSFSANGTDPITNETSFEGAAVPDWLQAFTDSGRSGAGVLKPIGDGNETAPERLIVGDWDALEANPWDYVASGNPLGGNVDTAYAVYWSTQLGGSSTFRTSYGLGPLAGCDPATESCGSVGDDDVEHSNGTLETGPGNDIIKLRINQDTEMINVFSGEGDDEVDLDVEDPTSDATIVINTGGGADTVLLPDDPGLLEVVIKTGPGPDNTMTDPPQVTRLFAAQGGVGGDGYDVGTGGGTDDVQLGSSADDVSGGGGKDELGGGDGRDLLLGGAGGDLLLGGGGVDRLIGGRGKDLCITGGKDKTKGCERTRRSH